MQPINFEKFKQILDEYLKPRWDKKTVNWHLRNGGGEFYIQDDVLQKAAPFLTKENLSNNIKDNLVSCLNKHYNLLSKFEFMQTKEFIEGSNEAQLKENFNDLLYGTNDIAERLSKFNSWSKLRPIHEGEAKKIGIKPIVMSYFLAMTDPINYAFCKPKSYKDAVRELLGKESLPKDPIERLLHCTIFYKEILNFLQINYGLENGNLLDVHSLFWALKSGFDDSGVSIWDRYKGGPIAPPPPPDPLPPDGDYTKEAALKDLFISEKDFDYVMSRLKSKKNIILQGPPGVGKTFIAKRLAYYLMGSKDDTRISMVQFHQSYSYEDFIQGFRPNEDGKFTLRNGLFFEFCRQAVKNPGKKYIFIIDEINRGNLSKIFGEMLMLIEADKRGQQFAVPLTYGKGNSDTFHIPENLHLIGTMNTADRSLAMVDYALRRRFSFIDLEPQFKNPKFRQNLEAAGIDESLITLIIERMVVLNQTISEDTKNLGPGYCIGHSYFCPTGNENPLEASWYRMVIKSEIEPLLREYWFDDPKRVADNVGKLLAGIPE